MNSEALTLTLSRRLAIADGRNQQEAIIATARLLRSETKSSTAYAALGDFITCQPGNRQKIINEMERMFTNG